VGKGLSLKLTWYTETGEFFMWAFPAVLQAGLKNTCIPRLSRTICMGTIKNSLAITSPLLEKIISELENHLHILRGLHYQDLGRKYAGVFLVNALEQKYLLP
jgi:hypothetical protein